MSISDDPRGSRRGQPGTVYHYGRDGDPRNGGRSEQRNGSRQAPPRGDDRHPPHRGDGAEHGNDSARQQQPSFSAYRPEAYAASEARGGRGERQDWEGNDARGQNRPAPEPYRPAPAPASERARPQQRDTFTESNDPYDNGARDYNNEWRSDSYSDTHASQFASSDYYAQHDEPNHGDAQSVHDRFFAADNEPAPAQNGRHRSGYSNGHDYANGGDRDAPRSKPAGGDFYGADDDGQDHNWDNYEQAPPPAEAARAFPPAKLGRDEDLDADYFADEDEFEGEDDYAESKKGGSKKLMAAILVGAVITGGGLAYVYKSQSGDGTDSPPVMTADTRPVKESPTAPGGREFPNGGKMIYDRLENASEDQGARRSEQPPQSEGSIPGVVTTGASGTLEERIQNAVRDAKKGGDQADASAQDTPRAVRTETIRPDGTAEPSRVQRRQAPAEGGPTLAAGAPSGVASREAPPAAAAPAAAPRAAPTQIAAATPAPPAAAPVATGSGESGMFVQIAARNDQAAAMAAFADLQQKYASVLGNYSPSVRKVDLGDKGVWYRLLVGPMASKPDADKLCEDLKTAGMKGCFSRKE